MIDYNEAVVSQERESLFQGEGAETIDNTARAG